MLEDAFLLGNSTSSLAVTCTRVSADHSSSIMGDDLHWSPIDPAMHYQHLHPTTTDADYAVRELFKRCQSEIIDILLPHTTLHAVGLVRRGFDRTARSNPFVLLVTGRTPQQKWSQVSAAIQSLLAGEDAQLASTIRIELFQADLRLCTSTNWPVPAGAPLSVANVSWATGTVGGYFRLSLNDAHIPADDPRQQWTKGTYALTCHHIFRPTRPPGIEASEGGQSFISSPILA